MARTRLYVDGVLKSEDCSLSEVHADVADAGGHALVWIDLCAPQAGEMGQVADALGLHDLAVQDALDTSERPKLDHYATHEFLNMYAVRLDTASGTLATSEVAAFVLPGALVTVRKDDRFEMHHVVQRWDDNPDLAVQGVSGLLYGLIDYVVDGHFDAVQALDEAIESLEDLLFEDRPHDSDVQRRSFELRKSLVLLRRVVLPMREVVNTLMRRDLKVMSPAMTPYYQDVYDHVLRATEWTESLRDLVTTILETNLTLQGNRLNVITKKITSWAAIIAVTTAVTGFYGQNVPYPGFGKLAGFWLSSVLIVVLSVALYAAFKRKDWL